MQEGISNDPDELVKEPAEYIVQDEKIISDLRQNIVANSEKSAQEEVYEEAEEIGAEEASKETSNAVFVSEKEELTKHNIPIAEEEQEEEEQFEDDPYQCDIINPGQLLQSENHIDAEDEKSEKNAEYQCKVLKYGTIILGDATSASQKEVSEEAVNQNIPADVTEQVQQDEIVTVAKDQSLTSEKEMSHGVNDEQASK